MIWKWLNQMIENDWIKWFWLIFQWIGGTMDILLLSLPRLCHHIHWLNLYFPNTILMPKTIWFLPKTVPLCTTHLGIFQNASFKYCHNIWGDLVKDKKGTIIITHLIWNIHQQQFKSTHSTLAIWPTTASLMSHSIQQNLLSQISNKLDHICLLLSDSWYSGFNTGP